MEVPFSPLDYLAQTIVTTAHNADLVDNSFTADVRPASNPRFGDYQANGVLPWAKRQKTNPRELAMRLDAALREQTTLEADGFSWEVAGPGFLNFRLSGELARQWLTRFGDEPALREGAQRFYGGRKLVVDFSSPNTAKEMHIGHIRSTVIGEALCRLVEFAGAETVRDNHIGDWGTQFGIILLGLKRHGLTADDLGPGDLPRIEEIYRETNTRCDEDPALREAARQELVRLQDGDPASLALWRAATATSYAACEAIYARLNVRFDVVLGESFYEDQLDEVCAELERLDIAREDQGALVIFHPEHPRFKEQPFIIRKRDGASNYATTDLATMRYRVDELGAEEVIVLTDARQRDHFEQLWLTTEKWFAATDRPLPAFHHLTFGVITGEDGKALKTRSGGTVGLAAVLDEAEERARAVVAEKNPDLTAEERDAIARVVGIGAVQYYELMQNRTSDYVFAWDRMLSFDGNTAPYLLYALARLHSIFRKAGLQPGDGEEGASAFTTDEERALARQLMAFPQALQLALSDFRPHLFCNYLYELSGAFSTFYNANRVIGEAADVQARRLLLCTRTLRWLQTGLQLLGLRTLERM